MKSIDGHAYLGPGAVILALALAGCGGGDSVSSTPAAPPMPPASYTRIIDMAGNRTFQTGGVTYNTGGFGFANGTTNAFGGGVTVSYTAATDSYTVSAPGAATQTFSPIDVQPANPANPGAVVYVKTSGTTREQLALIAPTSDTGVPLSYTVIGTWGVTDTAANAGTFRIGIGGAPTVASDLPRSGTATYSLGVRGTLVVGIVPPAGGTASGRPYNLLGSSSGTFTANFGAGTVQASLTLAGKTQPSDPVEIFGTVTGGGTLASGGPGFTGTLSGSLSGIAATGSYSGVFLGPQAQEVGFGYTVSAGNISAVGPAAGIKQ